MPEMPLVSVVILSYKRRGPIARVIESVLAQDYPALELIIVDNGSGPEITSWLASEFARARLIALPDNIGAGARNYGIEAAAGEVIVNLDNDVYFDQPDAIRRIIAGFHRHPAAGCLVFRVYHPETGRLHVRDWCHPRSWQQAEAQEFETFYITEGAAAFRREVFHRIEPYWTDLFIGHEGYDLGLRLMDAGYEIWYVPDVKVWHLASRETRPDWRPFYYYTRNLFPIAYRNYPFGQGLFHVIPRLLAFGLYSLQARCPGKYLLGIRDGLRMLSRCRGLRRPVRKETLRRIRELKRFQPGLVQRVVLGVERMVPSKAGSRIAQGGLDASPPG